MKMRTRGWMAAALLLAAGVVEAAEPRSTNTSERAYVLTNSQAIDGVCYDVASRELTIFFHTGTAYVYREVPEELFRDFARADSPGHFYHQRVRGQYASHRLSEGELVALVDRHDGRTRW